QWAARAGAAAQNRPAAAKTSGAPTHILICGLLTGVSCRLTLSDHGSEGTSRATSGTANSMAGPPHPAPPQSGDTEGNDQGVNPSAMVIDVELARLSAFPAFPCQRAPSLRPFARGVARMGDARLARGRGGKREKMGKCGDA